MKRKTKKLPLIYDCKGCVFCIAEYIGNIIGHLLVYRCKNRDLESKYRNIDPLKSLEKNSDFPEWCPLEEGEEIEVGEI